MPISTVIHTNEQSIDRVLAAGAPVLLVFWGKSTPLAAAVESTLDKLAQQYAGKIECVVRKHDEGDSQQRIVRYGLSQHGMVITDAEDKVLWSESGHKQTKEGVVAAITKVLGG